MAMEVSSIYEGDGFIIPMAEVCFIEKDKRVGWEGAISIIMNGTTWNPDMDTWNNMCWINGSEADLFLNAWRKYRKDIETDSKEKCSDESFHRNNVWIDRKIEMPDEKPHRNIEIKYFDSAGKEFTALVSSMLIATMDFAHWREATWLYTSDL